MLHFHNVTKQTRHKVVKVGEKNQNILSIIRHRPIEDGWQRQHHHHRGCDRRLRGGPPHPYRRHHPHLPEEKADRQM